MHNSTQEISNSLVEPSSPFRFVVDAEERRVEELLDVTYFNPIERGGRLARFGKGVLARAGVRQAAEPEERPRPWLENSQDQHRQYIADELRTSRERLRENISRDIDRVAIDGRLRVREDSSILPTTIRLAHQQAESNAGRKITFIEWMSDLATDEQLLNVWQWHDDYLHRLDESAEFKDRIRRVKADYKQGLDAAIAAGDLSPELAKDVSSLDSMRFRHGSPLSPVMSIASAQMLRTQNTVHMRDTINDSTLFHEITHGIGRGFIPELDEGATDLIADRIYAHSPTAIVEGKSYQHHQAYRDDIASLELIQKLSDGACDLHTISRAYAGKDAPTNTVELLQEVDDAVGVPMGLPLFRTAREAYTAAQELGEYTPNTVAQYAAYTLRRTLNVVADATLNNDTGLHRINTVNKLVEGITSTKVTDKYDPADVLAALQFAIRVDAAQQEYEKFVTEQPG